MNRLKKLAWALPWMAAGIIVGSLISVAVTR